MKRWLHDLLALPPVARVADVGCGRGDDIRMLAEYRPESSFIGFDRSENWIRQASEATNLPNLAFVCADVSQRIPLDDGSVDAILCVNLLECVPDKLSFLAECARVLRPGGRIVLGHFDWDTQTFDGNDRDAVRRIVHAYGDWQQAWMDTIDPWTGRRLASLFAQEGSFAGEVHAYTLVTNSFEPDSYGRRQAESFGALVSRGLISCEEYESFIGFQRDSAAHGRFFYSITMFAFAGSKRETGTL